MSEYTLHLEANNDTQNLPLVLKESDDFFSDYFDKGNSSYVFNDYQYFLYVTDDQDNIIKIDSLYVNNEIIEDNGFLARKKPLAVFLECFGVIKIEVILNGVSYVTQNTHVHMKEGSINTNIKNMIDYIYDNCDKYLYEEHKNSKVETGILPNDKNISIDSKLSLLNEIYDIYLKSYNILKNAAQSKVISIHKIGDFNDLQNITSNTINYIVNHPEELVPVDYNSGISVNKQYYQPSKTLVQSVGYSYDIYENQVIVGFLKTVIRDLKGIKLTVETRKNRNTPSSPKNGYIDSAYYIYTRNTKMLNNYLENIDKILTKFKKLYVEYKKILNVSDFGVVTIPRYTNIFRKIMPYNIIFKKIIKWFNCGNYDMTKSDLLLSFMSISKIYEYFCLLKINRSLEKCGYKLISELSYKYNENRYYHNTTYNNTFEFSKDNISVTVYFQPVIYGKAIERNRPNGIGLFRNTKISITDPNILALLDERGAQQGNYYTPDYLIKITEDDNTKYYILDAKHTNPNNLKRYQLPALTFKYLFSISTFSKGNCVAGMCILCGKAKENTFENLYDVAESYNIPIYPRACICCVTGTDVENDSNLIEYVKRIEST